MLSQVIRNWNEMSLYRKIRRVISISLIALAIWALTPYLYNREVNEEFPAPAAQPAVQQGAAQPDAQPATAAPKELISGAFVDGLPGHNAEGRAVVYALDGGKRSLRLEDFTVTNGPDLFVVLSPNADPNADGIGEQYVQLDGLKGNKGSQNYDLAADLDLGAFQSVVIWCRSFNVVFGYASLGGAGATTQEQPVAQEMASDAAMMTEVAPAPKADAMSNDVVAPAAAAPAAPAAPEAAPAAPEAAAPPAPEAPAPAVPAGPVALQAGTFIDGPVPGDKATGTATIYRLEDGARLVRLENFDATNGPDLFVVLSPNANPVQDGIGAGALRLAALKGNKGNQNYELPAEVDLGQYRSVVIWCRAFNIVFGYATLADVQ